MTHYACQVNCKPYFGICGSAIRLRVFMACAEPLPALVVEEFAKGPALDIRGSPLPIYVD